MKKSKKFILPAALVLVAVGSAFASNQSKKGDAPLADGYVKRPNELVQCQNTGIKCSTSGGPICTADVGMGTETLWNLVGTSCPTELHFQ
ncbi:DUF6520 family protein [Chryseobacterium koreense]|uniref:Uncharacterized protein n=1 Tax=Chryseobacterium koreense CCUG 49689 TaxID=1304281 RepID=A0A0J7IWM4_9FLAO|nr:DUF6520 family protein [Chryseobacterium koreense]KMQ70216.1 hypothetical protein ACM44_13480 [Chryseobacterium koreense CCUG 49689]MBB5334790.1 hypothetical protein [Chryseobacterium koreense]